MQLPKIYTDTTGKYVQHNGKPKLSYSQFSSWNSPEYKNGYVLEYMFGIAQPTNIFATFGGHVGEFIEAIGIGETPNENFLPEETKSFLRTLTYPPKSVYEEEIVVDCGDFVIQGFIDRITYKGKKVSVIDFKTGNIDKKVDDYASASYGQTTLYCFQKTTEGYTIENSQVLLLGRKGNGREGHPLRLSGESVLIDTPYSEERAALLLKEFRRTANEISNAYKLFLKLNA